MEQAYRSGVAWTEALLVYQGYRHLAEDLLEELLYCKIAQKADAIVAGKESESMAQTVVFECESP